MSHTLWFIILNKLSATLTSFLKHFGDPLNDKSAILIRGLSTFIFFKGNHFH